MSDAQNPELIDTPVDPITGPAGIVKRRKPDTEEKDPDPLRGPLGDTTAEPYENEG
jgi:hypothetical protein